MCLFIAVLTANKDPSFNSPLVGIFVLSTREDLNSNLWNYFQEINITSSYEHAVSILRSQHKRLLQDTGGECLV